MSYSMQFVSMKPPFQQTAAACAETSVAPCVAMLLTFQSTTHCVRLSAVMLPHYSVELSLDVIEIVSPEYRLKIELWVAALAGL